MKALWLGLLAASLLMSCSKNNDLLTPSNPSSNLDGFVRYTIGKGQQYCDQNSFRTVETSELKFIVRFDSTAIYRTTLEENQYDINKLFGFSDNNAGHHQYSARFGWRWSDDSLRLFAYVYNNGEVSSVETGCVSIGANIACSIRITAGGYLFSMNEHSMLIPRSSTTVKALGYQLYPYFGGNETAPHDIRIWIKPL